MPQKNSIRSWFMLISIFGGALVSVYLALILLIYVATYFDIISVLAFGIALSTILYVLALRGSSALRAGLLGISSVVLASGIYFMELVFAVTPPPMLGLQIGIVMEWTCVIALIAFRKYFK